MGKGSRNKRESLVTGPYKDFIYCIIDLLFKRMLGYEYDVSFNRTEKAPRESTPHCVRTDNQLSKVAAREKHAQEFSRVDDPTFISTNSGGILLLILTAYAIPDIR